MRVLLKREDLAHTGAHKINNAIGQCLLTLRMGKPGVRPRPAPVSMVSPPQPLPPPWGSAAPSTWVRSTSSDRSSTSCGCGSWGRGRSGGSGAGTLKDAVSEALRAWVASVEDTHYVIGSVVGPTRTRGWSGERG